jgi:hypothetical protein
MKPLAHWAIHHQLKLRLQGRDYSEIWGLLVAADGAVRPFRYERQTKRLAIGEGDARRLWQLDAYGFERPAEEE